MMAGVAKRGQSAIGNGPSAGQAERAPREAQPTSRAKARDSGKAQDGQTRLLPYQIAWIEDRSPLAIAEKSRRIGLTWASSLGVVRDRLGGIARTDALYLAHREQAAREFMETSIGFARDLYGAALEVLTGTEVLGDDDTKIMRIDFPDTGRGPTKLLAMTSNPHALRGFGGDVILDEFAFHRDQRSLLKAAMPVRQWGGTVRVLSTHNGRDSEFNRLIKRAQRHVNPELFGEPGPNDPEARLHKITIEDAVDQGLVERINLVSGRTGDQAMTREAFLAECRQQAGSEEAYLEEYMCEPRGGAGSYMPPEMLAACVHDKVPAPCATPEDLVLSIARRREDLGHTGVVYLGVDIGRVQDRFVIHALARAGERYMTLGILVMQGVSFGAMEDALHLTMRGLRGVVSSGGYNVGRASIDATGLGMQLAERMALKYGGTIDRVTITGPVKAELVTGLRETIERRAIDLPDDQALLDDYGSLRREVTKHASERFTAERNEHGHADRAIACALAIRAAKTGGGMRLMAATDDMWGVFC